MRQVFNRLGSCLETKSRVNLVDQLTIYFPHPLLHVRTSHNVEGILFITLFIIHIVEVFYYAKK